MQDRNGRALAGGLLESALDLCADPVEIVDSEDLIIFVNDAWCRMSGLRSREVIGTKRAAVGGDGGEPVEAELTGRGSTVWGAEMEEPSGETRPALLRRVLSPTEGGSQYTVTVYERSYNRDLRVLVHRLSNVLMVIMTSLDFLERAVEGTSQGSRLSLIRHTVAAGLDALESIRIRTGAES